MELMKYYNQYVVIEAVNGKLFAGLCDDYFYSDENESRHESIVVNTPKGDLIEFYEYDIENIWITDADSVKKFWIQKPIK